MASPNLQVNDPVASRALSEIAQYSQDIRYKPGKLNLLADALSRPSGTPPGLAYCPEVDVVASVKKLVTTELAPSKILQAQEGCQSIQNLQKRLQNKTVQMVNYKGQKLMCEVSTGTPRPVIPKSLVKYVLQACHDLDHCGQKEVYNRAKQAYFWPSMGKDISTYVSTCHPCQSVKPVRHYSPKTKTFKVPDDRFEEVHVDVVGPLPQSEGMSYLFSMIDRKSRWYECIPMSVATSKSCAEAFVRGWLQRFGCPKRIICDNANTFTANLWSDLTRILGIQVTFVPLYHQQTNGAVERQHRTLKESIKASLIEMGDVYKQNWMTQLPFTLLGRRVAYQPDLDTSSAMLTIGASPVIPGICLPDHPDPPLERHELLKTLQMQAAQPPIDMSRHKPPTNEYMPDKTNSYTCLRTN